MNVADPAVLKFLEQLKELFQRVTALEEAIKRHEQISAVVFAVLVALGLFSYITIRKWIIGWMKTKVAEGLKPALDAANTQLTAAQKIIDDHKAELGRLRDETKILLELATTISAQGSGDSAFIIQTGSRPVKFNNTNYLSMEQVFDFEFPAIPVVLVGEARSGAWLVVKVDARETKKFTWAATNLLGASNYETEIQWIALVRRPKPEPKPAIAADAPPPKK